jgi:ubiquinone/menaquinone biosynthesis C-methylase UbiE
MSSPNDDFARFEHDGWQKVAGKYDSIWSTSTRQFIPPLMEAVGVEKGMRLLDVGSGPGYVAAAAAERGASTIGVDFSQEMVSIAQRLFPSLAFETGDAQQVRFDDGTFDRVLANFALLHVTDPDRACSEACRVLKPGGKFGFSTWAPPKDSPYAAIIDEALERHGDLTVFLPAGPDHYLYSGKEELRAALIRAGFAGETMTFQLHRIEWLVPTAAFVFDAERFAGVRTAGILARQRPANLEKIREAIEAGVKRYPRGNEFAVPKAAYLVTVTKSDG